MKSTPRHDKAEVGLFKWSIRNGGVENQRVAVEEQKAGGCSGFQYGMMIEEERAGRGDQALESHGSKFSWTVQHSVSEERRVDFVHTIAGGGFTVKNPNDKSTCGWGSSLSTE